MKDLLKKFENKEPVVFNWKMPKQKLKADFINSLRAGGGTRMRKGLDINEVLSLAKQWR
jgi:hypothetical protein